MSIGSAYIHIVGNVVADPEMKKVGEKDVAAFSVAVNKRRKGGETKTGFWDVEAWEGLAGVCEKYLRKGRLVSLRGPVNQSSWKRDDGTWGKSVVINPDEVLFMPDAKQAKEQEDGGSDGIPF